MKYIKDINLNLKAFPPPIFDFPSIDRNINMTLPFHLKEEGLTFPVSNDHILTLLHCKQIWKSNLIFL